ncbi:MAG TPA: ribonuclease Z [Spirochaetota bacterium]|nr:ribonuclease Z [Spirochaetota bacterium]HOD15850.1 ribonuclease Z [Spirochaetota bacterium]HPG51757.1 ribonuclease Z [Spirochaetota bacterium]HPN13314.1 ribonuclease Z [Spirochaetota bacterium]
MTAKLAFLGTGTCVSTQSNSASLAISDGKEMVLVDCGGGCYHQISRVGDAFFSHEKISTVLLTHFHPDHASGLIDLLWGEMWDPVTPRTASLTLVGPPGLARFTSECVLPFIGEHRVPFDICFIELGDTESFNGKFLTARAHRLAHTPTSTGYCLQIGRTRLGVTGDTGFCDNLLVLLSSSDVAIMEWSLAGHNTVACHLSDGDFMRLIQTGVMPPKIFITHMYPQPGITVDQLIAKKKDILGAEAAGFFFPGDLDIVELS